MNISVGIVGLPNVGKSTLFNALLKKQAALAANYPFATIEPNVGIVPVPDGRLEVLARITAEEIASPGLAMTGKDSIASLQNDPSTGSGQAKLPPIKPALIEFVDIAGLVKGASEGAGLGNKFLSHIREVKVIAHVVRAFEDSDVPRYEEARLAGDELGESRRGSVGVKEDYETISMELILADLQTISKIKEQKAKTQIKNQKEFEDKLFDVLDNGKTVRSMQISDDEKVFVNQLGLLTAKPEIIVLNISENDYQEDKFEEMIKEYSNLLSVTASVSAAVSKIVPQGHLPLHGGAPSPTVSSSRGGLMRNDMIVISAKIESELAELRDEDAKEYLKDLGVEKSGLERLIQKAYEKLGLISFLTAGEKEVRAWTIRLGSTSLMAAGEIHTDFMAKFIKAEVVSYEDFVANNGLALSERSESNGWKGARDKGKARLEGRDYIIQDGDVVEFKIGR